MLSRRNILEGIGGLALAGAFGAARAAEAGVVEIRMRSAADGTHVRFDPLGVLIQPGQRVRWVIEANVHTATAYHPRNDNHSLRIPQGAEPWDSDYLVDPGARFEVTLTVPGVYDYFCKPHEMAGMVGRIIVGAPGDGPGTKPFDYFKGDPRTAGWMPVPPAAQAAFPAIDEIVQRRIVRAT